MKAFKIRYPIAVKLIVITLALLVGAVASITFESNRMFESNTVDRVNNSNRAQASARATQVEGLLTSYVDKTKIVASLLLKDFQNAEEKKRALDLSFQQDRDLVNVEVLERGKTDAPIRITNKAFLADYGQDERYIQVLRDYQKQYALLLTDAVFAGQIEVRNATTKPVNSDPIPMLSVAIPFVTDEYGKITHIAIADIRLDRLQQTFAFESATTMYLIDRDGQLLAHPDEGQVIERTSMTPWRIVDKALTSEIQKAQLEFEAPESREKYIGFYAKTSFNVSVVAQTSKSNILAAARDIRNKGIQVAGRVVAAAILFIFMFSISLTSPIERLVDMATEVAAGNFEVQSNVSSKDEVGALGSAFDEMVVGLQERDKVKNVLNKFHGSAVTEDLLKGDLALGGSRKDVTVFFSDIRDFTKFSEGHTPEEVVEMLNEYFAIMVSIINQHGGVVDKFIGDAIMAIWGAPEPSDRDAFNAVRACLEMRKQLEVLNHKRVERGQVPIKIGIGIHTGKAIAGNIGSDERMEYTVIGDSVNTAARIEASTKAFGTDLLISGETMEIIQDEFLIEQAGQVEVKGKSQPLTLNKVRGYVDENGQEVRIQTEWSDFEGADADKVKMVS